MSSYDPIKIIPDHQGGCIIFYSISDFNKSYLSQLFLQRINAAGNIMWDATGISVGNCKVYQYPAQRELVSDLQNGAILVWDDFDGPDTGSFSSGPIQSSTFYYYAQRVDGTGNLLWGIENRLFMTDIYQVRYLKAVSDLDGGIVVTWTGNAYEKSKTVGTELDIYAQRLDALGNVLWASTGVPISRAPFDQYYPCIINSGKGSAIIAWLDGRNGQAKYNFDIYAQKVFENGTLPVELAYFYATNQGDYIFLLWGTESEENNLGWNIYRALDQSAYFEKINNELIPGVGNSPIPVDYEYIDSDLIPNHEYTYYLEQIDFDGRTSRSWDIKVWLE